MAGQKELQQQGVASDAPPLADKPKTPNEEEDSESDGFLKNYMVLLIPSLALSLSRLFH